MQPGSDFNPYAAPTEQADRSLSGMHGDYAAAGQLASLGQRFSGSMLDSLFLLLACLPGLLIALLIDSTFKDGGALHLALAGVGVLILLVYQTVIVSNSGQSLAKRVLKTKIVRLDGSPAGFVHGVLLRTWVVGLLSAIPFLGSFIGILDAVLIFREDRRTLHDHIAGTNVIQIL